MEDIERTTEDATNISDSMAASQKRRDTMQKNFMNLYQVDINDHSNFDLVLDTTILSSVEAFERVSAFIDSRNTWPCLLSIVL